MRKVTQYTYLGPVHLAFKEKGFTVETFAKRIFVSKATLMRFLLGKSKKIGQLYSRAAAAKVLDLTDHEFAALMKQQAEFKAGKEIGDLLFLLKRQFFKYIASVKPSQLPPVEMLMDAGVTRMELTSAQALIELLLQIMPEGPGPDELVFAEALTAISKAGNDATFANDRNSNPAITKQVAEPLPKLKSLAKIRRRLKLRNSSRESTT